MPIKSTGRHGTGLTWVFCVFKAFKGTKEVKEFKGITVLSNWVFAFLRDLRGLLLKRFGTEGHKEFKEFKEFGGSSHVLDNFSKSALNLFDTKTIARGRKVSDVYVRSNNAMNSPKLLSHTRRQFTDRFNRPADQGAGELRPALAFPIDRLCV